MNEKRKKLHDAVMLNMTEQEQKEWVWNQMYFMIPLIIMQLSDEEVEEELLKLG
jgi:hypothetical protein